MRDKITTKRANDHLQDLINFCHKTPGAVTELRQRLSAETNKEWHRENVYLWLHPNPKKRVQPLLGVGLMLVEIGSKMMSVLDSHERGRLAARESMKTIKGKKTKLSTEIVTVASVIDDKFIRHG